MNLFDAISMLSDTITGQIASSIFSVLPEDGPAIVVIDRQANRYVSEPEVMAACGITDEIAKDLCTRVDDGLEPVIAQAGAHTLVGTHLATDCCNYGYAMIVLKNYCPVAAMANINLIETILAQINLIARLTEKLTDGRGYSMVPSSWGTSSLN